MAGSGEPPYTPAVAGPKRDHYEVLGVDRAATADDIKRAYRKLAMQFHPDRNPGDHVAEDRFKEATEAYTVLSDPDRRRRYDRFGHDANRGPAGGGFEGTDISAFAEIFEGLFGEVFGRRKKQRVGRDLEAELVVSFVEAARGADKPLTIERPAPCGRCEGQGAEPGTSTSVCQVCAGRGEIRSQRGIFVSSRPCQACLGRGRRIDKPCRDCDGSGARLRKEDLRVRVPAGVEDGAIRTVRGGGEVAPGGAGDLHVTVRVEAHPLFVRDGADVRCTVPIGFPQAVLGDTVEIPTLDGKVSMKIPQGTQSGKQFRLRGKGIPLYGGAGSGDQLVTIVVEVPTKLSREQRRLVEQLAGEMGIETSPQQASFLEKLRSLFD